MNSATQASGGLQELIDTIEGSYEYCLAYAAQGRHTDRDLGADGPRGKLQGLVAALEALPEVARARATTLSSDKLEAGAAFFDALEQDAATSIAIVRLILDMNDISSQVIDNLNASIHIRALLTDLFLVDEALKN